MGYCIGGTLQALTLAWLAAKNDDQINAATFIVSLQDFSRVGDTSMFLGKDNVDFIEQQMMQRGYLDSREMSNMFNLLRPNDLIWSNVVNNYLLGQKPPAFDLLHWNSDGTRMARAAHSWYLRNTYVENNLDSAWQGPAEGRGAGSRQDQAGHLRRRGREGPHRSVGCGLAHHPARRAATSATCWRPAATSLASSIRRAARVTTGSTKRSALGNARGVAADRHGP